MRLRRWRLQLHLSRRLVAAQALVDGVTHDPFARPVGELDLRHKRGLDEARVAWRLGSQLREGTPRNGTGGELCVEALELAFVEARSGPSRVAQHAPVWVRLVVAQQQRPKTVRAAALAGQ